MVHAIRSLRLSLVVTAAALATACGPRDDNAYDTAEVAGAVGLPDTTSPAGATTVDLPSTDAGVVDFLVAVDSGEVELAQLARTKASNAEVKSYAQTMLTEHRSDLRKLAQLKNQVGTAGSTDTTMAAVSQEASTIVTTLKSRQQQTLSHLQGLTGGEFDRQYIEHEITDHQDVLDKVQQLQSRAQNAQLQTHLSSIASVVQKHLERARTIQSNLASTDTSRTN